MMDDISNILSDRGIVDPKLEFRFSGYVLDNISYFKKYGIEISIDRNKNSELNQPMGWEEALKLDFIKDIESKTEYLYHSHRYSFLNRHERSTFIGVPAAASLLIINLSHKSWKDLGEYIYLDESIKDQNIRNISDNLDDIFNLGWPDGDYDLSKSWGILDKSNKDIFDPLWNENENGYIHQVLGERPRIEISKYDTTWKLRFSRNPDLKNSDLLKNFMIPFLRRIKSEYNIEILRCKNTSYDLEFSEDFETFKILDLFRFLDSDFHSRVMVYHPGLFKPIEINEINPGHFINSSNKFFDLFLKIS